MIGEAEQGGDARRRLDSWVLEENGAFPEWYSSACACRQPTGRRRVVWTFVWADAVFGFTSQSTINLYVAREDAIRVIEVVFLADIAA